MMVDTSAIVAILQDEPEAGDLLDLIAGCPDPFTTVAVVFEAALVLSTRRAVPVLQAAADVRTLLRRFGVEVRPLDELVLEQALLAAERFGKGRGHPAQLNLVDCLSYGAARAADVGLIYKGDDFSRTDLPPLNRGG